MTAPLFRVPPGDLDGRASGHVVHLAGSEARHAAVVLRLAAGEEVLLADTRGGAVSGRVLGAEPDDVAVEVTGRRDEPAPDPAFVLVQALAKEGRDEAAVESATELGVDVVVPWQADRSIVRWRGDKVARGRARWEGVVARAAKQSRRARWPLVEDLVTTAALAARLDRPAVTALVLHEDAATPLADHPLPDAGELILVVGPEGGIGDGELERLTAAGATPVRLGPHVLRSSNAGPAALAVLGARSRWR